MKTRKVSMFLAAFCIAMTTVGGTIVMAAETTETEVEFSRGEIEENTYQSELLGIKCEMDDQWYVANEEEMAQISGLTQEIITDEDIAEQLEEGGTTMDFYAQNTSTGASVNIQIQQLGILELAQSILMDDQEFMDFQYNYYIENGYDQVIYDSIGLTDGTFISGTTTFCGEDTPCIFIAGKMDVQGTKYQIYETMVFVRNGSYLATVTSASYIEDTTEEGLSTFSYLED